MKLKTVKYEYKPFSLYNSIKIGDRSGTFSYDPHGPQAHNKQ